MTIHQVLLYLLNNDKACCLIDAAFLLNSN